MKFEFDNNGRFLTSDSFHQFVRFIMSIFDKDWFIKLNASGDEDHYIEYVHTSGASISFHRSYEKGKVHCSGSLPVYQTDSYNSPGYYINKKGGDSIDLNPAVMNPETLKRKFAEYIQEYLTSFDEEQAKVQKYVDQFNANMRVHNSICDQINQPKYKDRLQSIYLFNPEDLPYSERPFSSGTAKVNAPDSIRLELDGVTPELFAKIRGLLNLR
jgi:hypothetical protein